MIHLSCPECGWALFGKAALRVDAAQADLTCPRCKCVVRVSLAKLHDGDPKFAGHVDPRGDDPVPYTYDEQNNRIAMPVVSRSTDDGR